ncbi:MAG: hypothetical protein E4H09_00280 [Spirochaetales bacterium]|nr:MAG: hypothetical protein E4H09_00280 [Spirochaetales bacterium]
MALLRRGYDRALAILTEHRAALDALAKTLLEEEQVTGEVVKTLINGNSDASGKDAKKEEPNE